MRFTLSVSIITPHGRGVHAVAGGRAATPRISRARHQSLDFGDPYFFSWLNYCTTYGRKVGPGPKLVCETRHLPLLRLVVKAIMQRHYSLNTVWAGALQSILRCCHFFALNCNRSIADDVDVTLQCCCLFFVFKFETRLMPARSRHQWEW